jgi:hypothetical protein
MSAMDQAFCMVMFSFIGFCWMLQKAGQAAVKNADVRKAAGKGALNLIARLFR